MKPILAKIDAKIVPNTKVNKPIKVIFKFSSIRSLPHTIYCCKIASNLQIKQSIISVSKDKLFALSLQLHCNVLSPKIQSFYHISTVLFRSCITPILKQYWGTNWTIKSNCGRMFGKEIRNEKEVKPIEDCKSLKRNLIINHCSEQGLFCAILQF